MLKDFQGSMGAGDPSGTEANSARSPLSRNVGGKGQTASCPSKARSDTGMHIPSPTPPSFAKVGWNRLGQWEESSLV